MWGIQWWTVDSTVPVPTEPTACPSHSHVHASMPARWSHAHARPAHPRGTAHAHAHSSPASTFAALLGRGPAGCVLCGPRPRDASQAPADCRAHVALTGGRYHNPTSQVRSRGSGSAVTSPGLCPAVTLSSVPLPQGPRTSVPSASPLSEAMPPRGSHLTLLSFRKPPPAPLDTCGVGFPFVAIAHDRGTRNHTRLLTRTVHGSEAGGSAGSLCSGSHKAHSRFWPATLLPAGSGGRRVLLTGVGGGIRSLAHWAKSSLCHPSASLFQFSFPPSSVACVWYD